jgi:hypothetical protein
MPGVSSETSIDPFTRDARQVQHFLVEVISLFSSLCPLCLCGEQQPTVDWRTCYWVRSSICCPQPCSTNTELCFSGQSAADCMA